MTRNGKYSRGSLMMSWIKLLIIVWNVMWPNDQLTNGGPSVMPELPSCVAGPPFGAAHGSALSPCRLSGREKKWPCINYLVSGSR